MTLISNQRNCNACPKVCAFDGDSAKVGLAASFDDRKEEKFYKPKETIFHRGDPCDAIYCVHFGEIAISKSDREGNTFFLRIADSRAVLGLASFFAKQAHSSDAIALTPTRVCIIRRPAVEEMIARNPKSAFKFFCQVAQELDEMEDLYLKCATHTVRERLIQVIDFFKRQYGSSSRGGGIVVRMPFSRGELAAMVAARPESISRAFRQLRDEGIVDLDDNLITIPNTTRFEFEIDRLETS